MILSSRVRAGLLVTTFALVACKHDAPDGAAPPLAVSTNTRADASAVASAVQPASSASAPSLRAAKTREPLDAKQRAQLAAYRSALEDGRRATKAAKYDDAAAAFTRALKVQPGDPRAQSERGFAAYRAKNYASASEDLYQAAARAEGRVLRAQIFYNLGLVREAEGLDPTSAFALSNQLNATPAAQKKIAGKPTCLADVDRRAEPSAEHKGWLAFYATVSDVVQLENEKAPTTDQEAKKLLCAGSKCEGASPWVVRVGESSSELHLFLVHERAGGLQVAPIGDAYSARCSGEASAKIVHNVGGIVVVRTEEEQSIPSLVCFGADGEGHDCTDKDGDDVDRQTACGEPDTITIYSVFDLAKGTRILRASHDDALEMGAKSTERTKIETSAKALTIRGPGCNEVLPFVPGASGADADVK